jgi:hypothetical protein
MKAGERRLIETLLLTLNSHEENLLDVHVLSKNAASSPPAETPGTPGTANQRRGR